MILFKTVPGKKSYYIRKCMGTKDVYNHRKKGPTDIKNIPGYIFNMKMHKKYFLLKCLELDFIFTKYIQTSL